MVRTPAQKIMHKASWATVAAVVIIASPAGLALVYAATRKPIDISEPVPHAEPASPTPTQSTPMPEPTLEPVRAPVAPAKVTPAVAPDQHTGSIPFAENVLGESPTYARVMSRWASPRRQ